jgi:hypothetical protein
MLLIAVGFGTHTDPYTCCVRTSEHPRPEPDPKNPGECLDFICHVQHLAPDEVDELFVIESKDNGQDPEVKHHYTPPTDGGW